MNSSKYTFFSCRELCLAIDLRLSNRQYLRPLRKRGFPTSDWYTDGHQQRTVIGWSVPPHFRWFHAYNNETGYNESRLLWLYLSLHRRFIQRKQRRFWRLHQCYLPVGTGIEGNHHGIQWSVLSRHKNETRRRQNTLSYQRLRQEKWLQLSDRQFPLYRQQHPSQSGLWGAHISTGEVCQDSYMKGGLHTEAPSALVTPPATRIQIVMPCC